MAVQQFAVKIWQLHGILSTILSMFICGKIDGNNMWNMEMYYYHSKKRTNAKGLAPIWGRVIIKGIRTDFSTGIFVAPDGFSDGKIIQYTEEDKILQIDLDKTRVTAMELYLYHKLKKIPVSSRQIVLMLNGGETINRTFISVVKEFIKSLEDSGNLKDETIEKYGYMVANLEQFLRENHSINLLLEQFRYRVAEEFRTWVKGHTKCKNDHATRHLQMFKKAFRFARRQEYIEENPLIDLEAHRDKAKKPKGLKKDQFLELVDYQFASLLLHQVRELFVFSCDTAMDHADIESYEVKIGPDGEPWFFNERAKNESQYAVPCFPQAKFLHDKYGGNLPKIESHTYNRMIKEIAQMLNWGFSPTTKNARKTFYTLRSGEGWSPKSISLMMGHKHLSTTERSYADDESADRVCQEKSRRKIV